MVYVDPNFEWPKSKRWPHGSVSHMYADTPEELHAFAKKIGLRREWCSDHTQPTSALLHYDLNPTRRAVAVRRGAVEVPHEHKEPYVKMSVWFWKHFCEDYVREVGEKEDLVPKRYKRWRLYYRMYLRGVTTCMREYKRGEKEVQK